MGKIIIKRKPNVVTEPKSVINFNEVSNFQIGYKEQNEKHIIGYLREWYEKLFNEFPPVNEQPLELIKTKIEYELVNLAYKKAGKEVTGNTLQNYWASKEYKINDFSEDLRKILKAKIESKGRMEKEKKIVLKQKEKKPVKPVSKEKISNKITVSQRYNELFENMQTSNMSFQEIAEEMQKSFPERKKYTTKDIEKVFKIWKKKGVSVP